MRSVGAGIEPYMLRSVTAFLLTGSSSVVVRYDSTSVTSSTPLTDWMFSGSTNVSVGRFEPPSPPPPHAVSTGGTTTPAVIETPSFRKSRRLTSSCRVSDIATLLP